MEESRANGAAGGELPDADVLVVGAGVSGIDVAYRLAERCPDVSCLVVEERAEIGGTWDLFRYPGVRSDSDFYTLAYPFHPWRGRNSIVDGDEIRSYLHEVVREHGIDRFIRCGVRVVSADWRSGESRWRVTVETTAGRQVLAPRFVVLGTGYYDDEHPHDAGFAGTGDFEGVLVHPQFWPEGLDCRGHRVAVIGSGATAVTLVPALADGGADVTMVQRTPSYVVSQPRRDAVADLLRRVLPPRTAHRVIAAKNTRVQWLFYRACRRVPGAMRALMSMRAARAIGAREPVAEHLSPSYDPWDQRVCITPDDDFFRVLRNGTARIVTGSIDRVVTDGLLMTDGTHVPADVIVTATGLRIELLGGIDLSVDGVPVDVPSCLVHNGTMLSGVPNLGFVVGYLNASWTLRADVTAVLLSRIVRRLVDTGARAVVPVAPAHPGPTTPMLHLDAGYVKRAAASMPRVTGAYPWAYAMDVLRDRRAAQDADPDDGLRWIVGARPTPDVA